MLNRLGELRSRPDLRWWMVRLGAFGLSPFEMEVMLGRHEREAQRGELAKLFARRAGPCASQAERARRNQLIADYEALVRAPDLLTCKGLGEFDRGWTRELHTALGRLRPDITRLRLDHCELRDGPDGYLAVAVSDPGHQASVRPGDLVQSGFAALSDPKGGLSIWPRLYRVVCTNGAVFYEREGEEVLSETGSIALAIERCLSGARLERSVQRLQRAAAMVPGDPLAFLQRIENSNVREDARREFLKAHDPSGWGAINALTAAARRVPDFRERLALERMAGELLIGFEAELEAKLDDKIEALIEVGARSHTRLRSRSLTPA